MTRFSPLWQGFFFIISIALLALILRGQDMDGLWQAFGNVSIATIFGATALVCLSMIMRAQRWRIKVMQRQLIGLSPVFCAMMTGYLANNILPARGGDVLQGYLLGKQEKMPKSFVLGSVFVIRLIDALVISLFSALAALFLDVPVWLKNGAIVLLVFSFIVIGCIIFTVLYRTKAQKLVNFALKYLPDRLEHRVASIADSFLRGMQLIARPHVAFNFLFLTLLIWSVEAFIAFTIAQDFGLYLNYWQAVVLLLFAVFAYMLPSTPGQIGVFEVAVLAGAATLGLQSPELFAFALTWHVVLLVVSSVLGVVCLNITGNSLVNSSKQAE